MEKKIIIVGATSGIGLEVAKIYISKGYRIGLAGRRLNILEEVKNMAPEQIEIQQIDVTDTNAGEQLLLLIEKLGGMDLFLLSSGIGTQNRALDQHIELTTVNTNCMGFARLVTTAYNHFKKQNSGHLAVISSVAGSKGFGVAPSYSATKRFQSTYIDALAQLAHMEKYAITLTDIRPGFVQTDLLKSGHYPLLMKTEKVARKIVKALHKKKRRVVIDWRYSMLVFLLKLIPSCIWERLPIHN